MGKSSLIKTIYYPNGERYYGEVWSLSTGETVPWGNGTFYYSDGFIYEGHFHNGYINGIGKYYKGNNIYYHGHWKLNKQHGIGYSKIEGVGASFLCTCNNVVVFKQAWYDDKSYYEGTVKDGKVNGFGLIHTSDYLYKGEFLEGNFHNFGIISYKNGSVYEGQFLENNVNGLAVLYDENGFYIGYFKDDLRHGFGVQYYKNGQKYTGFWKENVKNGFGIETFKNAIYVGDFEDDAFEGVGRFVETDGKFYMGEFYQGMSHGYGIIGKNGRGEHSGKWEYDAAIEECPLPESIKPTLFKKDRIKTLEYEENWKYTGEVIDNKRNGFGILSRGDGSQMIGYWKDDQIEGYGMVFYANHSLSIYCEKNGKFLGTGMDIVLKTVDENKTTKEMTISKFDIYGNKIDDFVFLANGNTLHTIYSQKEKNRIIKKFYEKNKKYYSILSILNDELNGNCYVYNLDKKEFEETKF